MSGVPATERVGSTAIIDADFFPLALVTFCAVMNFGLALINNLVASVQEIHVIAVQLLATLSAAALIVLRRPRISPDQAILFVLLLICIVISTIYTGKTDVKILYDLSVVPIFVVLGSTVKKIPRRLMHAILILVLLTTVFEAMAPDLYSKIVNPLKYYANTRSWVAAKLDDDVGEAGFYFGAQRDGEDHHRASGLFLEPLSLGYFACVAAIYYLQEYKSDTARKLVAVFLCCLLTVLADVRAALGVLFVITAGAPILRRLPRAAGFALPFLVIAAGAVLHLSSLGNQHISDLAGRLSWTFVELLDAQLGSLMFGGFDQAHANDSAILYFGNVSGLPGYFLLLYISAGVYSSGERPLTTHAALIYLAGTSLFGHAFASIKTGALLGFVVGSQNRILKGSGHSPRPAR